MWRDVLRLLAATLTENHIKSALCDGDHVRQQAALGRFEDEPDCNVLFLSSVDSASGANLQHASIVLILDPPGKSARDGFAMSRQAIGRSVRLGQTRPVRVVRFCLRDTIEGGMFREIEDVGAQQGSADGVQDGYTAEGFERELPEYKGPDVVVADDRSLEEAARQQVKRAREEGNFVDLVDSPDIKPFVDETRRPSGGGGNAKKRLTTSGDYRVKTE